MNASLSILRNHYAFGRAPASATSPAEAAQESVPAWNPRQLAEQQIRGLVRRVFSPGWPRPARQVVFSAAEVGIDIDFLCRTTAELLGAQGAGRVGLVEAWFPPDASDSSSGRTASKGDSSPQAPVPMRTSSRQLSPNVWQVPAKVFLASPDKLHNGPWLRARLGELRREFDYSVIQVGPVSQSEDVSLLANLADGLVLTVEAHRTRRLVALQIRKHLVAANVRLLGVVLRDRTFPIPHSLYRRL